MKDFIIGWILGRRIAEQHNDKPQVNIEEFFYTPPKRKEMTVYEYWPAFDNDVPSLEIAYKLYNEDRVCHVIKDGVCKCYFEFDGDDGYIEIEPNKFFDRI